MEIIKNKEFYFSKILEDVGFFETMELLDKVADEIDVEYCELYTPYFDNYEISLNIDNFLIACDKTEEKDEILFGLLEIAKKHVKTGEDILWLEF